MNPLSRWLSAHRTGWLSVTADLQVIDPGLKKTLSSSGLGLINVDTATIAGIRFRVRF